MLHFTPQQIQGGGKYQHKTLMGNWQEDLVLEETKFFVFSIFIQFLNLPPPQDEGLSQKERR